ncbi:MAG: hypothetical protein OXG84_13680 [Chloroflexi bacterium]|nr:hypothetical protein [Chloroflexota bacterium]
MPLLDLPTKASLHYEDMQPANEQAPVILIHGMLGAARIHLGHVMDWLHIQGFRVIGLTLRGYGESQPKPRDFPDNFYQRDADDLLAFLGSVSNSVEIQMSQIQLQHKGAKDTKKMAYFADNSRRSRFSRRPRW